MATHLDLEEQEQLDKLKHFWSQYGNLITWVLVLALGGFAAFTGWQTYQRDRGAKAGALYDELDKAVRAGDADKAAQVLADMKERYGSTTFADQASLLAAKLQFDKGRVDAARSILEGVAATAGEQEYRIVARLRLAAVLLDEKKLDEALKALPTDPPKPFAALVADRRGDILMAQGKPEDARIAYQAAYDAMEATLDYRRLVDAKLTALGAAPQAASAPSAASAAAPGASK